MNTGLRVCPDGVGEVASLAFLVALASARGRLRCYEVLALIRNRLIADTFQVCNCVINRNPSKDVSRCWHLWKSRKVIPYTNEKQAITTLWQPVVGAAQPPQPEAVPNLFQFTLNLPEHPTTVHSFQVRHVLADYHF